MDKIFYEFGNYCTDPTKKSGKATSYAHAMKYLCEFLNLDITNRNLRSQIASIEADLSNKNSSFYLKLLAFLSHRGQSSYLVNGFMHAAIPKFINFLSTRASDNQPLTKVEAIKKVIIECGGRATWDDIYKKSAKYYPNIANSAEWKAGLRGVLYRELKNNQNFKRNPDSSFSLIDNTAEGFESQDSVEETVVMEALNDRQIISTFDRDKTIGILPTSELYEHQYNIRTTSGTAASGLRKVYSGRKAEKYFMDFLKTNSFVQNRDFFDVANQKSVGFDIKFFDIGLEIKNIKNGSFYLSDNEIAHLENNITQLVLVDVDNGIWLVKTASA